MNFSWAMDLDPKGANNQIKEVIDRQYANDEDEVVVCLDTNEEPSTSSGGSQGQGSRRSVSQLEHMEVDGDADDASLDHMANVEVSI